MKKMPTIFKKDYHSGRIENVQNIGCEWVFKGEGIVTRKFDGTCCMIKDGKYYKRRCVKKGKPIPSDFRGEQLDEITGKHFGWMPVTKEDKWHMEAYNKDRPDGTYELVGPRIQGNPEGYDKHVLISHTRGEKYIGVLRTFYGIRAFMEDKDIEGLVFHHPDGRMAKIKKSDYGIDKRRVNRC